MVHSDHLSSQTAAVGVASTGRSIVETVRPFFLIQIVLTAIVSLAAGAFDSAHGALSAAAGGAVVLLNLILLSVGWAMLLRKKFVALAVAVIVIKYAILGIIIYQLMLQPWLSPAFFLVGVSSLLVTIIISAGRKAANETGQRKHGV